LEKGKNKQRKPLTLFCIDMKEILNALILTQSIPLYSLQVALIRHSGFGSLSIKEAAM